TIRGKADAEGKHKKQSGGHGQFGVCRVKMEPIERGKGVEFVDDVFGGAIPKNWIPSVEKGIRDAAARGYLAGFPVTDFRAILYDGKYHDVDIGHRESRSEEHTSELQSPYELVCRLLLEKKNHSGSRLGISLSQSLPVQH